MRYVSTSRCMLYRAVRFAALSGGVALVGCGTHPAPSSVSSTLRPIRVLQAALVSPSDVAASVQAQPLYRQAQSACKARRYASAATLLQRLASSPDLTPREAAFVRIQQKICLQDAGLPLPAAVYTTPSTAPRVSASASLPVSDADCGPRALLLLCRKEGVQTDLSHLRQLAGTTKEGTSLDGLERTAKAVGLKAEGVQVSREALPDIDMPAIAYVNGNHFIAVLSVQGRGEDAAVTVHDPNYQLELRLLMCVFVPI